MRSCGARIAAAQREMMIARVNQETGLRMQNGKS
jgi:hypothetical protein